MSLPESPRGLLWNAEERRVRAGWRLVVATAFVTFASLNGELLAAALDSLGVGSPTLAGALTYVGGLSILLFPTGALLAAAVLVDRRSVRDLGLARGRAWWADLAAGLAMGVALPATVFAIEYALGFVRVTGVLVRHAGSPIPVSAGGPAAVAFVLVGGYFVCVGLFEELLFRGYLLVNAAEGSAMLGDRQALAVAVGTTSVLFGIGHGLNPSATPLATAIIALYGVFLAAGFLLTGRLALPIGVHIAWNLAVSAVFGFPVSGFRAPVTLLAVEQTGPPLLTGGAFGPEGGLLALVALAVGVALLLGWVRWREGDLNCRAEVTEPALRTDRSAADHSE